MLITVYNCGTQYSTVQMMSTGGVAESVW